MACNLSRISFRAPFIYVYMYIFVCYAPWCYKIHVVVMLIFNMLTRGKIYALGFLINLFIWLNHIPKVSDNWDLYAGVIDKLV